MKFATALLFVASSVAVVSAHIGLLYPVPRGGYGTKAFDGRIHTFIGYKDKVHSQTFPCGGYPMGPVTPLKANQLIDVRFYASSLSKAQLKTQPKLGQGKTVSQARHGGGTCEFSLSYDGGKTYGLIGRYTKTCPDAYFKWPIRIPSDVPSCSKKGQCLFVWSWTANILPQYYHNCADITLQGVNGADPKKAFKKSIAIVDFGSKKKNVKAPGDGHSHTPSTGPSSAEKALNSKSKKLSSI
ncbi:hypothetical protein BGZ99_003913 [Dissophora globulifera]|uniref:Lytic polysaccharide monooxygenase n=1 Tax=Dissophora globulifera TaxID=979702 RepID=A0A9P6RNU4_9FUNG|nr:hypothetical protein BGZ99_003913 [Dissophora globulifera]